MFQNRSMEDKEKSDSFPQSPTSDSEVTQFKKQSKSDKDALPSSMRYEC